MKKFYIYSISYPITGQPFYIGKGTISPGRSYRWVTHIREAEKWTPETRVTNITKTKIIRHILDSGYQPLCRVVFESSVESSVFLEERRLISLYGRIVNGTGILTNLIEGGSGLRNYKEQMQSVRSVQNRGQNNPMYGKKHTHKTKQKIRQTRKERSENGQIIPTKHSEQHKQNLRIDNPGGKSTSKPIYQIDTQGNIIKLWRSSRHAGLSLNIKSWRNISHCANYYKTRTVGGFYWRWSNTIDIIDNLLSNIELLEKQRTKVKHCKPVQQLDNNFNIIKIWPSASEAARNLRFHITSIPAAIKAGRPCFGYWWKY